VIFWDQIHLRRASAFRCATKCLPKRNVGARVGVRSLSSLLCGHDRLKFGNGARTEWRQRLKCVFWIPQLNCASRDTIFRETDICILSRSREKSKLRHNKEEFLKTLLFLAPNGGRSQGTNGSRNWRNRGEQCLWHNNLALFTISTSTQFQLFLFSFSLCLFTRLDCHSQSFDIIVGKKSI
jgi:hypothetical protein